MNAIRNTWAGLALLAVLHGLGCSSQGGELGASSSGGSGSGGSAGAAGGAAGGGSGPTLPGTARIEVGERYGYEWSSATWRGAILGTVRDAPDPTLHGVVLEQGACRYYQIDAGNCDPPCNWYQQYCATDDTCQPYPVGVSAGTLTITGLGEPIAIEPQGYDPGLYYGPETLPAELFEPGDSISASFAGATFPAIDLTTSGVAPMDTDMAVEQLDNMVAGQDFTITWTAGSDPSARVRVIIRGINVSHGAPLDDIIWCEGPDDGELVVPSAMVDLFPLDEIPSMCTHQDCPQSELSRFRSHAVDIGAARAELVVHSTVYFGGAPQAG